MSLFSYLNDKCTDPYAEIRDRSLAVGPPEPRLLVVEDASCRCFGPTALTIKSDDDTTLWPLEEIIDFQARLQAEFVGTPIKPHTAQVLQILLDRWVHNMCRTGQLVWDHFDRRWRPPPGVPVFPDDRQMAEAG